MNSFIKINFELIVSALLQKLIIIRLNGGVMCFRQRKIGFQWLTAEKGRLKCKEEQGAKIKHWGTPVSEEKKQIRADPILKMKIDEFNKYLLQPNCKISI